MNDNGQNMMIYSIIEQIEDAIENSPKPKMGGGANKRNVDLAEMQDLIGDLKVTIPEDIRRANSVLVQANTMLDNADEHARELVESAQMEAEAIIEAAKRDAEGILAEARKEFERMVSEDEIYQEAQKSAKLLAMKAEYNADMVFENAKVYADGILADVAKYLENYNKQIAANRVELGAKSAAKPAQPQPLPEMNGAAPAAAAQGAQQPQAKAPAQPGQKPQRPQQPAQPGRPRPQQGRPQQARPMPQQEQGEVRNAVRQQAQPARAPQAGKAYEPEDADEIFDDYEETRQGGKKGLFSGLFKKKAKADFEEDYDDYDDFDDFE